VKHCTSCSTVMENTNTCQACIDEREETDARITALTDALRSARQALCACERYFNAMDGLNACDVWTSGKPARHLTAKGLNQIDAVLAAQEKS
jgi:hypothetical protein